MEGKHELRIVKWLREGAPSGDSEGRAVSATPSTDGSFSSRGGALPAGDQRVDFLISRADRDERRHHGNGVGPCADHSRRLRRHPGRSGDSGMIYAVECVHCQETLLTTAQIGDAEARIVASHLEARHPAVLDAAVNFDDPGLAEILHHVRVTDL